jgi:hypothetical protein
MALMEHFLPQWQFQERHALWVDGITPEQAFAAIEPALQAPDPLIQMAITLREWPGRLLQRLGRRGSRLPAQAFGHDSFTRLGAVPGQEMAFGLAGQFWRLDYGLVAVPHAQAFEQLSGEPKLVLDVRVKPGPHGCLLVTRTRVHCPSESLRNRFAPYWYLIRPVSGLIRRRLLARMRQLALAQP